MVDYVKMRDEWFQDHPEMTTCKLCGTIVKKRLTNKNLCPQCYLYNNMSDTRVKHDT